MVVVMVLVMAIVNDVFECQRVGVDGSVAVFDAGNK